MRRLALLGIGLGLLAWGLFAPLFGVRMMYTSADSMRSVALGHSVTVAWSTNPRIWVTAPGFSMNQFEVRSVEGDGPQPWAGAVSRIACPLWVPAALCPAWTAASLLIEAVRRVRDRRRGLRRGFEVVLGAPTSQPRQRTEVHTNDSLTSDDS